MARYEEVADDMRRRIAGGEWPTESRMPSISQLKEKYDVPSLGTIRRAQQILVGEGLLRTEHGVGAWVIGVPSTGPRDVLGELEAAQAALSRAIEALRAQSGQPAGDDPAPGQ